MRTDLTRLGSAARVATGRGIVRPRLWDRLHRSALPGIGTIRHHERAAGGKLRWRSSGITELIMRFSDP